MSEAITGNNAKLREALEWIQDRLVAATHDGGMDTYEALRMVEAALAAPPRNCDRFANETDAQIAFLREVCLIDVTSLDDDPFDCWTDLMKYRYVKWLFAEAEGSAK